MSYFRLVKTLSYHPKIPAASADAYTTVFLAYIDSNNGSYTLEKSNVFVLQKGPFTYVLNRDEGFSPEAYPRWNEVDSPWPISPAIKQLYK